MTSEWREARLSELCSVITDGAHKSPPTVSTGMPMASVKDLTRHGIQYQTARHISLSDYEELKRSGCCPEIGDVLIAKDGNSALDTVCVHVDKRDICLLSSVAIFRPGKDLDSGFLRYFLESPRTKYILKGGYVSGSAIPRVVLRDFKMLPVRVPSKEEQIQIGSILSSLDDKIELNRETNETLEGIAKALFRSWFVDFDPVRAKTEGRPTGLPNEISELFPDSFEESELGEIPSGWKVGIVRDLIERTGMGPFGSRMKTETFKKEGVPIIKGGNLKGMLVEGLGPDFLSEEHAAELESSCVRAGDIVLTHRGTLGQVSMVPLGSKVEKYVASQSQFYLRPSSVAEGVLLLYFFHSSTGLNRLLANSSGVGVPSLARPSTLTPEIQITIPPLSLLEVFAEQVVVLQQSFVSRQEQQETLIALRDALLPRLISGELRVPDAEKMLEELGV